MVVGTTRERLQWRMSLLYVRCAGARALKRSFSIDDSEFKTPEQLLRRLGIDVSPRALAAAISKAEIDHTQAASADVRILAIDDPAYPSLLREIRSAPPILYVKGSLPKGHGLRVAVVGSRDSTASGCRVTEEVICKLARAEVASVISGLALGIDSVAHRSALGANLSTVAVLGCGLGSVYPKANTELAEHILASGGSLVSEQPMSTPVTPARLVARDRIETGLSNLTFLIESGLTGGSMHTAGFTLTQGRPLYVLRPGGSGPHWLGNRYLLQPTTHQNSEILRRLATLYRRGCAARPFTVQTVTRALEEVQATSLRQSLTALRSQKLPFR